MLLCGRGRLLRLGLSVVERRPVDEGEVQQGDDADEPSPALSSDDPASCGTDPEGPCESTSASVSGALAPGARQPGRDHGHSPRHAVLSRWHHRP